MKESSQEPTVLTLDFHNTYYILKKNSKDKWNYAGLKAIDFNDLEIIKFSKKRLSVYINSASKLDAILEGYNILNSFAHEYAKNSNAEYVVLNPYANAYTRHILPTTQLLNDVWNVEADAFLVKKK